ncbi:DsbA family protein [Candidatus Nanosynbacter featherlites]|nr:thioredoxin domain-containing protein [Candidatus Nanosynbacter featherlites]
MNGKTWGVFIAIVVTILGGMVYLSVTHRLDISDIAKDQLTKIIPAEKRNGDIQEHTFGSDKPKVIIIEYGDYQCPGCRTVAPRIKSAVEKHKDNVQLIFRNFPLSGHTHARLAASVAEAAGLQGKYWEMHDLLYENQDAWSKAQNHERNDIFMGYAKQLKLDESRFNNDLSSDRVLQKISFDTAVSRAHGITATPTIFINGKKVEDLNSIDTEVENALKAAGVSTEEKKAE